MGAPRESAEEDAARLRRCLNDLVSVMALPAVWAGNEPVRIVGTLQDALAGMLGPAFVFARLNDPGGGPAIEMARVVAPWEDTLRTPAIAKALDGSGGDPSPAWPPAVRVSIEGVQLSVTSAHLGLQGEFGVVVVGSERVDFPGQAERLILDVAVNQAAIGLHQARLLSEQRRIAAELDARVAHRTAELAAANQALQDEVAERRHAEEALRQSERESRLIVDSIPGLVALLTATGEIEVVNRRLLEYFGQTVDELKQWGTTDTVHPEDLPHVIDVFTRSIAAGSPYEIAQRFRRSDGVYRWFQNSGFPLRDPNGDVVRWCVLLTDIDALKRAEAALRRAYDSFAEAQRLSKTGSFITDLHGDDHNWSDEAFRIFEFDPATTVTVERVRDLIHPDDRPAFDSVIARGMTGIDARFSFRIVTARGALKHVRGVAHVVEEIEGRPMLVGALQDVTESMVADEALNLARSELARVSRMATLSTLTASIAHEINQPLSGIVTNASTCLRMLAADHPDVDGARETARRTIRDGNRASDVIARLRALFSKKEFTLESLDLNEATREVIALSSSELQRNRVIVQSELAADLPAVTGDRVQLQQVILNLLRNASDAMAGVDDRPRLVVIGTEREDGERVRVTVRDAGVGVDRQSADKLFDAFHTTKSGGMGIGLSISRSIVERHHGRLWAESNRGPGATFSFSIPCDPGSVIDAAS